MTARTRKRRRWLRWLKWPALAFLALVLVFLFLVWIGAVDRWARAQIVQQVERITGGAVELESFTFHWWSLRAEMEGFVVHGREPRGAPPLFAADRLLVDVRVDALFRRQFSLDEVRIERPQIHVRVDESGTNVPAPRTRQPDQPAGKPIRERIFEMVIRSLRIEDGTLIYNNTQTPLVAHGDEFRLAMDFHADAGGDRYYSGDFAWQEMELAARKYLPFPSNVALKFTLRRDNFTLDTLRWTAFNSEITANAALSSFTDPAWTFRYGGRLDLANLRDIFRKPRAPLGQVRFSGQGSWAQGELDVRGSYEASNINVNYDWFTASGLWSRSSYRGNRRELEFPDFQARTLGGTVTGKISLVFEGMKFRTDVRLQGMNLAAMLEAVDHRGFPTNALHWDGVVEGNVVATWVRDLKSLAARGRMLWSPPLEPTEGLLPATARLDFDYSLDRRRVILANSEISTPSSRTLVSGELGARGSAIDLRFRTTDLLHWNDFIYRLRDPGAERVPITGSAEFTGRMTGRLDHPTFTGRVSGANLAYGKLRWDEASADIAVSPDQLRLDRVTARRDRSTLQAAMQLDLERWRFQQHHQWSASAELVRAPLEGLQSLAGTNYPISGLLTAQIRGEGTRANPQINGLLDVASVAAWGFPLDRARARITLDRVGVSIQNAELRLAKAPAQTNGGRITGDFRYAFDARTVEFDLTGAVIPLEAIQQIQTAALPLGGQLSFQLKGSGPLAAPSTTGSLRFVNLRVGNEVIGSFEARLATEASRLRADFSSAMQDGALRGQINLTLSGDYAFTGNLSLDRLDLDPFVLAALKLKTAELTGHSRITGQLDFNGFLARPDTITVKAEISQFGLNYRFVQLANDGPLRFTYSAQQVRIDQAHFRGTETDFTITGFASFAANRRLDLDVNGQINLQLISGLVPDLNAAGSAAVNLAVEGTVQAPSLQGQLRVQGASANHRDFPTGLSNINGLLVFDAKRLVLENLNAEAGGGKIRLGGSVTYGAGPMRYDLTIASSDTRVRYPEGMSWMLSSDLRLSGNATGGLLSGQVQIERLLLTEGFNFGGLGGAEAGGTVDAGTQSPFLRNLQLDITATSVPDTRIGWNESRFDTEAHQIGRAHV